MIKQKYQVTLYSKTGKYKPVSCLLTREQDNAEVDLTLNSEMKKAMINAGVQKICGDRRWGKLELQTYQYLIVKIRKYDLAKINRENKERYEKLKEEKFASGEWKRPGKKD